MGNPQDTDRGTPTVADSASPGQRLRHAREARQLTREAVAAQMRIEPKVIDALERDDYSQLPAAVFVRGYLRAYAKLVGLAAESMVDAFDQRTSHAPPPLVLPAAVGPDIETHSGYARWIVFALALLSLLLFYQWWHLEGRNSSPVAVAPSAAVPQSPPQPKVPASPPAQKAETVAETPAAVPTPEPGTPLENLYETPPDESGLGEVTATAPTPVTAKTAPAPAAASPVVAVPAPTVATTGGSAAQPAQPAAESKPQETTDAATGPLVMRFNDDCWVVIRDASGRALLQGLIKSGERHVLDGKPPFQLTLGNSPAVEIEYLGQRFDQSSYTGPSRIARFTLGK
jgi:cytoskeleton protein RodZ